MKKDLNSQGQFLPDYSLPRSKILRGKRNYQRLFETSTVLNSASLQFRYRIYPDPSEGCYIGFVAPKKIIRRAVKRNKIKRLLREVYRTQQSYLQSLFLQEQFGFHAIFMAKRDNLTYKDIEQEMIPILKTIRQKLSHITSKPSTTGKPKAD